MLELLIGITAISAFFVIPIDLFSSWKDLDNGDINPIIPKTIVVASFVPTTLSLFGVSAAYNISKAYMAVCFLFLILFGLTNNRSTKANKIHVLMEEIPCAISTLSLILQSLGIYAPISRFFWCVLDVSFIVGKIMLLNKKI